MRQLIRASIYREFLFSNVDELNTYIESGHKERWIVETQIFPNAVYAVVGEKYNDNIKLEMTRVRHDGNTGQTESGC